MVRSYQLLAKALRWQRQLKSLTLATAWGGLPQESHKHLLTIIRRCQNLTTLSIILNNTNLNPSNISELFNLLVRMKRL